MNKSSKMLFMIMMIMSTIMLMSSSNWINMWLSLEINLMSFIPLMSEMKSPTSSQSSMMYFLIQSMSSMMFIFSIMMMKMYPNTSQEISNLILTTMMMKLGMPPFHFWFPEAMNKMKWMMCYLLMTWQKMGPMIVISTIIENNKTIMLMIAISTAMGAIGGMNQTSTRKIMSYSSMNQMGWMMMMMIMYKKSWMWYMILYMTMTIMIFQFMKKNNILFINQFKNKSIKSMSSNIMMLTMLSMGGMPPLMGFILKWMVINSMIINKEFLIMNIMMWSSLITLSYYLRMTSSINLNNSNNQKWMMIKKNYPTLTLMMTINIMTPMLMMVYNFS